MSSFRYLHLKGGGKFVHDESPRLVIYDLDIGGPGHGDNTDLDE